MEMSHADPYLLFELASFPIQLPLSFLQCPLVLSQPLGRRDPLPEKSILQSTAKVQLAVFMRDLL